MSTFRFCILFVACAFSLSLLISGVYQYPYFISWDMDLITAIDLLRIHDNLIPLHINHPGLGMYMVLKPALWVAHQLGMVEVGGYKDLGQFINPMLGVSQLVEWCRGFNPYLLVGMGLATWLAVWNFFGTAGFWLGIVIFFNFVFSPSLWNFHLPVNRTEFYSLFYLSLAFLTLSELMKKNSTLSPKKAMWLRYLCLAFIALAITTKIQALLVVVFLLVILDRFLSQQLILKSSMAQYFGPKIALFFWGGTVVVCMVLVSIPSNFATFVKSYKPNVFFFAWGLWLLLFYFNITRTMIVGILYHPISFVRSLMTSPKSFLKLWQSKKTLQSKNLAFFEFSWMTGLILIGAAFVNTGWQGATSFFYHFKIFFLRINDYNTVSRSLNNYIGAISWQLQYHWVVIVGLVLLSAFILHKNKKNFLLLSVLGGLLVLNLIVGTRNNPQDALWNELFWLWGLVLICVVFLDKKKSIIFLLICFAPALGVKFLLLNRMPPFTQLSSLEWYSENLRFTQRVYEEKGDFYTIIMNERFVNLDIGLQKQLLRQAEAPFGLQALTKKTWLSPEASLANVGILKKGAYFNSEKIWTDDSTPEMMILGRTFEDATFYLEENRDYWLMAESLTELNSDCIKNTAVDFGKSAFKIYKMERDSKTRRCLVSNPSGRTFYLLSNASY